VPPEEAWLFSRGIDLNANPPVAFEGEPPPGVTDLAPGKPTGEPASDPTNDPSSSDSAS
jgi:hypothetical protein